MYILDGKKVALEKTQKLKLEIKKLNIKPKLVIIQVGNKKDSNKYVNFKIKKAKELGIKVIWKKYDENCSEYELIQNIKEISKKTNGIIVQLPLPLKFDNRKILNSIPKKIDVDGLNESNKLIIPATARGIIDLLNYYNIEIKSKIISVVGQSKLVGKPIADICEQKGAVVTRHNTKTGLNGTEKADILIVAAGHKNLIKKENIKKDSIIIDVGINILDNNKIIGDVDRKSIDNIPKAISPVPGGVGPMTVISLFSNLIDILK